MILDKSILYITIMAFVLSISGCKNEVVGSSSSFSIEFGLRRHFTNEQIVEIIGLANSIDTFFSVLTRITRSTKRVSHRSRTICHRPTGAHARYHTSNVVNVARRDQVSCLGE